MSPNSLMRRMHCIRIGAVVLMLFSGIVYAQSPKLQLGLSGGMSNPSDDFKAYTSPSLGHAESGYIMGIDLLLFVKPSLSLGISVSDMKNSVNAEAMAESIWEENKTASRVMVQAEPYATKTIMLDISYHLGLMNKKLFLVGGLSAGMATVTSPSLVESIETSPPVEQEILSATSSAMCMGMHLGVNYQLNKKMGLGLVASQIQTTPTFNFKKEGGTVSAEQKIAAMSIGLKLTFNILGASTAIAN